MSNLQQIIENAFEKRAEITPKTVDAQTQAAIEEVIEGLDSGKYRVAEKIDGEWVTHQWLKKAVLLSFRINDNQLVEGAETKYYDKVPLKFADYTEERFQKEGFRVVPSATVRKGAYISKNCVLMPSYVNIGAYVGEGTMVDTWATVGSCAQIGKNVHLSGGVGIGGVLEPLQANPTIIGDNCFIGARSEVVEGVIVEEGCVISMGVFIGQSTKIYDRETGEVYYGRVPAGSVVVSGSLPSKDGKYSLYCAVIVKKVDAKTLGKVGINELLRSIEEYFKKQNTTALCDVKVRSFSFLISELLLSCQHCYKFHFIAIAVFIGFVQFAHIFVIFQKFPTLVIVFQFVFSESKREWNRAWYFRCGHGGNDKVVTARIGMALHVFDDCRYTGAIQEHEDNGRDDKIVIFLNIGIVDVVKCSLNF